MTCVARAISRAASKDRTLACCCMPHVEAKHPPPTSTWFSMVEPVEPLAEEILELELPSNYDAQKNLMRGPSSAKQQELQRTMNRSALLE